MAIQIKANKFLIKPCTVDASLFFVSRMTVINMSCYGLEHLSNSRLFDLQPVDLNLDLKFSSKFMMDLFGMSFVHCLSMYYFREILFFISSFNS